MRRLTFYVYTGGLVFFLTAIMLVGVTYLFYGNSFTATSLLLIGGSVIGSYVTIWIAMIERVLWPVSAP